MCGIVGIYSKSPVVSERLGAHLGSMFVQLADPGPYSAGAAVYRDPAPLGSSEVCVLAPDGFGDWAGVCAGLAQLLVDVGMNRTPDGVHGDVAFDEASERTDAITPVPGGVGAVMIAMLLRNTVHAAEWSGAPL